MSNTLRSVVRSVLKYLSTALCCLVFLSYVQPVLAAGLGRVTVFSGLGQPLRAEIDVSGSNEELSGMAAQLASPDSFDKAGVFYGGGLSDLRFALERRGQGAVIKVSSTRPVNDPFLDFLVEANWPGGRVVRQYTFLLDPVSNTRSTDVAIQPTLPENAQPNYQPQLAVQPSMQPTYPSPAYQPSYPQPTFEQPGYQPNYQPQPYQPNYQTPPANVYPIQAQQNVVPLPTPIPSGFNGSSSSNNAGSGKSAGDYTVKRGDTMAKIASEYANGVSLDKMLVSIYRQNPQAFIRGNVNLVRSGSNLQIPDASTAEQVTTAQIRRVLHANVGSWSGYRRHVASRKSYRRQEYVQSSVSGRVTEGSVAEEIPTARGRDRVRVGRHKSSRRDGAAAAEEARLIAQKQQKDEEMRQQKQQEIERKKSELAMAKGNQGNPPGVTVPGPRVAEPAAVTPPAVTPPVVTPPPAVNPPPRGRKPEQEPDLFSDPLGYVSKLFSSINFDDLLPYLGGAALLVLAGLGYFLFKKFRDKKRDNGMQNVDEDSFDTISGRREPIASSGSNYSQGSGVSAAPLSQATGMLTDFSQSGLGTIDTNDVDPVAEAEVYMAYGRDAQAEEILVEAIRNDPSRTSIHVKLLEIYKKRRMIQQFETVAGELYAVTGGTGEDWESACQMGLELDPNNPLYQNQSGGGPNLQKAAQPMAQPQQAQHDHQLDFEHQPPPPKQSIPDVAPVTHHPQPVAEVAASSTSTDPKMLVFELPEPPAAQETSRVAIAKEAARHSAFDFDVPIEKPAAAPAPAPAPLSHQNFDFEEDRLTSVPNQRDVSFTESTLAGQTASGFDMSSLSLDLDEPSGTGKQGQTASHNDAKWEEVNTKLDLAKAYAEMSDAEGARELLQEVLSEGDAEQIAEAKGMLAQLK